MKILLTGANGYIGMRLLADFASSEHEVLVVVRNAARIPENIRELFGARLTVLEVDFLEKMAVNRLVLATLMRHITSSTRWAGKILKSEKRLVRMLLSIGSNRQIATRSSTFPASFPTKKYSRRISSAGSGCDAGGAAPPISSRATPSIFGASFWRTKRPDASCFLPK